ncbi:hypothetical protein N7G274_003745 [Stereocaulon virgatum]|uniref:Uncharacterized protein n=1 Tax=Stereocaulon virgatum TaxID=373712 RepID=A0ABR4ACD0_9LECA
MVYAQPSQHMFLSICSAECESVNDSCMGKFAVTSREQVSLPAHPSLPSCPTLPSDLPASSLQILGLAQSLALVLGEAHIMLANRLFTIQPAVAHALTFRHRLLAMAVIFTLMMP